MRLLKDYIEICLLLAIMVIGSQSCTHDSLIPMDPMTDPMDTTTNPLDTMVTDTTVVENPCDPTVVYFQKDILPIFLGSCAFSGCHDVATASDGIILNNYENIISTGEVKAFDLNDNDIYEVITETDADKVMPPTGKLDNAQINLIATWILQGAQDNNCDEEVVPCNTQDVSYNDFIKVNMQTYCNGCHATGVASGGVITDTYNDLKTIANDGRLFGTINWDLSFSNMPQGQDQLDSCIIEKIKSWIDAGAPNN